MNLNLSLLPARFRRAEAAFRTNLGMAFKSKSNVEPFYFGEMYFVSTAAHDGRPAFVRGVIDKMRSDADSMVGWSQWVLDEEASKRQKQKFLFLILAFLILLNASLLVWAIWRFI